MYFDLNDQARMELQLTKINNYHQQVEKIYLIGHRGMGVSNVLQQPEHSSLVFLENTVASFKEAIILGADGIELDVFSSKDRHVMVIHSDELRMHVYNNRGDEELLIKESSKTFIVGNKTYNQLRKLVVGPQGELIPTLSEILELVTEANLIRNKLGLPHLILNIELKNSNFSEQAINWAVEDTIKLICKYLKEHSDNLLLLENIYFCSFNHQALQYLLTIADRLEVKEKIRFAASVTSISLFGEDNIDGDYRLLDRTIKYLDEELSTLKTLFITEPGFIAYDAVIWNIYRPFIELINARSKQLHISAPNYRLEDVSKEFCIFLLKISNKISQIYFKCDAVEQSRQVLIDKSEKLQKYLLRREKLAQQLILTASEQQSSSDFNSQLLNSQEVLGSCLKRPSI